MHLNTEMEYNDENIKALLVEKLAGTISEEDDKIVNRTLEISPEASAYWQSLLQKFESSNAAAFVSNIKEDDAWHRVNRQLTDLDSKLSKDTNPRFKIWHYVAGAAAVLLIAFTGFWVTNNKKQNSEHLVSSKRVHLKIENGEAIDLSSDIKLNTEGTEISNKNRELTYAAAKGQPLTWATLVVPPTKDYKIKLDDGTSVWLNAASELRFPLRFNPAIREVYLTGEAYFEVAKNAKVPFIVRTAFADIKVHGTAFNVNAYKNENFATALVEGSISAVKDKKAILITPGQEVFANAGNLTVRNFDPELLSWRNGTYHFHRRSLNEIAQVLARWYAVKIAWKSTSTQTEIFTGQIDKQQPLAVVLSNLQLTSGIKSDLQNGILTFY